MSEFNPHSILERLRGPGSSLPNTSSRRSTKSPGPANATLSNISSNMGSTRDRPGSPGVRQGTSGRSKSVAGISKNDTLTSSKFDGDKSKLGQALIQPGPSGGMTYFDQSREKGAAEIREELETEVQRLRNELSECKKENKQLRDVKAELEEEVFSLKEKHIDRSADLRNKLVKQQQKINELSAMAALNAPKNRSTVYNHGNNNPLSTADNQLSLTRQTQYDRNIINSPPSFEEQRNISSKLASNAARTSKDFMAPTFTELMRQSAQKNQTHNANTNKKNGTSESSGKKPRSPKKAATSVEGASGAAMSMNSRVRGPNGEYVEENHTVGESTEGKVDVGDINTNIQYLESYMEVSGKPKAKRNYSYYDDGKGNIQVDLRLI